MFAELGTPPRERAPHAPQAQRGDPRTCTRCRRDRHIGCCPSAHFPTAWTLGTQKHGCPRSPAQDHDSNVGGRPRVAPGHQGPDRRSWNSRQDWGPQWLTSLEGRAWGGGPTPGSAGEEGAWAGSLGGPPAGAELWLGLKRRAHPHRAGSRPLWLIGGLWAGPGSRLCLGPSAPPPTSQGVKGGQVTLHWLRLGPAPHFPCTRPSTWVTALPVSPRGGSDPVGEAPGGLLPPSPACMAT